jgi:DNA-directed RNA polymerase subunit RPC12/RpoP
MEFVAGPAITAEWNCTRCGVTNRKLDAAGRREVVDRCVHCGLKHRVRQDDRPVRWNAEAA